MHSPPSALRGNTARTGPRGLSAVGWPGASQPRAPTDPYVTVSRHTALVVLVIWQPALPRPSVRSTAAGFWPLLPGPGHLLPGPQLLVLIHEPPQQVGVDAVEHGMQRRAVEGPVIGHPAPCLRVDQLRDLPSVGADPAVQPPGPHLGADFLQGVLADRGQECSELHPVLPPCPPWPEREPQERERRVLS